MSVQSVAIPSQSLVASHPSSTQSYSPLAAPISYNSTPHTSPARRNEAKQAGTRDRQRDPATLSAKSSISHTHTVDPKSEGNSSWNGSAGGPSGRPDTRETTRTPAAGTLGHRGSLPVGMDVREALSRCEDPTLGWSLQFWVTIADPVNGSVFFACPASGQCSWDPPVGAFVVPRMPGGEWWELADVSRKNRSYYYNTMTGKTQWSRPTGDAFVIPLGLIQNSGLPPRENGTRSNHLTPTRSSRTTTASTPTSLRPGPRPPPSPQKTPTKGSTPTTPVGRYELTQASPTPTGRRISSDPLTPSTNAPRTPLSIVDEGDGSETSGSVVAGWWERRKSRDVMRKLASPMKNRGKSRERVPEEEGESTHGSADVPKPNSTSIRPDQFSEDSAALPKTQPQAPIHVESSMRTKRMSTGLHPLLPPDISTEIHSFQAEDFSNKYFATKRSGLLRGKVPLERIMEHQKQPITAPLLVLSRASTKEAIVTFKVIQHVMGEREKPVEGARAVPSSSSGLTKDRRNVNGGKNDKVVVLEEIRWMIHVAVGNGEMRDEVYCQLIKQLTKTPNHDALVLGFQLFCVFANAFGPSKNFEPFVKAFLRTHTNVTQEGVGIMSKYCISKLDIMAAKGGRGRMLTIGEIEHASDAAFYPSVYGESLERTMDLQSTSYPDLKVPVILPFLADGILALGGLQSEGIFRVPGDSDSVSELKSRIDRGHYQLSGIDDPHVAASLFKLWLRELENPIVPADRYNAALGASSTPATTIDFVKRLPDIHRRVLLFVVSFFQQFCAESVIEITKMTPQNLALVLAPNILRTESKELATVFTNSGFESKFVLHLLEHLKPGEIDPEYVPTHGKSVGK
ncbi:hypothetical protein BCR39DRAFT_540643 [Naematelia encephala]|uniref:Rho GTPase activation protein n=1 Tax=Naematelia encephala TaxID=71784 RepID=A0A1Y2AVF9_9TREE|nr:hypothetical protein BCR39DRAFT_540643 [Naematelia encephala]